MGSSERMQERGHEHHEIHPLNEAMIFTVDVVLVVSYVLSTGGSRWASSLKGTQYPCVDFSFLFIRKLSEELVGNIHWFGLKDQPLLPCCSATFPCLVMNHCVGGQVF